MKKIVIFGAGKIGRSFVGLLFANAGYHIVFIDINQAIIDEINRKGFYHVIHVKEERKSVRIDHISGVLATDSEQVAKEIAGAELLAMSTGPKALPAIVSLIARGVLRRFEESPGSPLDIIIAENLRNAAEIIRNALKKELGIGFPVDSYVGLVETSVGKMVPIMSKQELSDDMLKIYAEPYNTLVSGTFFRAGDENGEMFEGDKKFIDHFKQGPGHVLQDVCGFDENIHPDMFAAAREYHSEISLSVRK